MPPPDEEEESDFSDTESIDSCEEYIHFKSIRNPSTKLEEAISFSWPGIYEDGTIESTIDTSDDAINSEEGEENKKLRKIVISTLLEEDDIAPLFDGSRWAGTRLWAAAVRAVQYLSGRLPEKNNVPPEIKVPRNNNEVLSILELGCGLGVPGMIFHLLGCNVVLTDQVEILSQLEKNTLDNFPHAITSDSSKQSTAASTENPTIRAMPLSWSRQDVNNLLEEVGKTSVGFDVVLNCDCVYEPLYGDSWHLLNEAIDELLKVNPNCIVISSMERRQADGIDDFLEEMRGMEHVKSVEKVWSETGRRIEIYMTKGSQR